MNCFYCEKDSSSGWSIYVMNGFSICAECRREREERNNKREV